MKIALKILKGILTLFLVIVLFIVIMQKVTHNKIALGNIYIFQVASESMTPEYQVGDVIIVKKSDPSALKVGDDVTYLGRSSNLSGLVITHRIIRTRTENNIHYFTTQGTANE